MSQIIAEIKNRIKRKNKNWLAIVCGETGSGKSFSALRLGEMIDPEFSIDNVVFRIEDFMRLLNSKKLKKGSVIIFDEAGVGIPAREWYTISNKAINYVLQTFRHKNLGVIFTTPDFSYIDAQTRKLFHNYIETVSIDFKKEYVKVKFFQIQFNPRYGKVYWHYSITKVNGRVKTIHKTNIKKPSKELIQAYEKKKKQFTETLNIEVEDMVKLVREKQQKVFLTPEDIAKSVLKKPKDYIKEHKGREYVDLDLIMIDFKVGRVKGMQAKKIAERQLELHAHAI